MEGPKVLQKHQRAALEVLVDNTFTKGNPGAMFRYFPTYFGEDNDENHIVYEDEGRMVAHGGMLLRWASLLGCTVRVGMVGAVAVDESYRGRNLAWECMEALYAKARREDVDFMLISGGRTLYLKAGARHVGRRYHARLESTTSAALTDPTITIAPATEGDFAACREAHEAKRARLVRPLDDWTDYLQSRLAHCCDTDFTVVRRNGLFAGYVVSTRPGNNASRPSPFTDVLEYGGDNAAIGSALGLMIERNDLRSVDVYLEEEDEILRTLCEQAGGTIEEKTAEGTILLLNFEQFMRRMHPMFETKLGVAQARRLRFEEQADAFLFSNGEETITTDLGGAVELIFGTPNGSIPQFLRDCFPVPSLAYGLCYV